MKELLADTAARAIQSLEGIESRRVAPAPEEVARAGALGGPLPPHSTGQADVIRLLDQAGSPATVASAGGRYFGFVTGGSLPAALAANWLAGAWDQNAALRVMSPAAAAIEEIALEWVLDLLGLPRGCGAGFVTGATMANFTCLAAARHALLSRAGWDVEENGLFEAPAIRVVVGGEVHVSLLKALAMLGLGRSRVTTIPVDEQGRMKAEPFPRSNDRTMVCTQAGNVNSGAFDPAAEICARARRPPGCTWMGPLALGRGVACAQASCGPDRRCRLLDGRLPQMAECTLRFRPGAGSGTGAASRRHGVWRGLSSGGGKARACALRAGSFAAGAGDRGVGGASLAGTRRAGRHDRKKLPARRAFRPGAAKRGLRSAQ